MMEGDGFLDLETVLPRNMETRGYRYDNSANCTHGIEIDHLTLFNVGTSPVPQHLWT